MKSCQPTSPDGAGTEILEPQQALLCERSDEPLSTRASGSTVFGIRVANVICVRACLCSTYAL